MSLWPQVLIAIGSGLLTLPINFFLIRWANREQRKKDIQIELQHRLMWIEFARQKQINGSNSIT